MLYLLKSRKDVNTVGLNPMSKRHRHSWKLIEIVLSTKNKMWIHVHILKCSTCKKVDEFLYGRRLNTMKEILEVKKDAHSQKKYAKGLI